MRDGKLIGFGTALLGLFILCAADAGGALDSNKTSIGYLYPAGAQQGQTVQIIAGGQFFRGAKEVYVTGEGVHAKVLQSVRVPRNLNGDQRKELNRLIKEARNKRLAELPPKILNEVLPKGIPEEKPRASKEGQEETPPVKMPRHPLIDTLDEQSLRELAHTVYTIYFPRNKLQVNRQLSELALIEVTVDADAKPGSRELRIMSRYGLSNPVVFQVGMLPEVKELEPNNDSPYYVNNLFKPISKANLEKIMREKPYDMPILINGQIMPGDVDRFRFRAKAGQQLVIEVQARSLIPYLADAVPGWFQATVSLYDKENKEVAFADDYRFNPDPVLFYEITKSGEYRLEIRDSIYRGREDFVYRVSIGEQPFITQAFPLGGKQGVQTVAKIDGKHLPKKELELDTGPAGDGIRRTAYYDEKTFSNAIPYAVNTLPECFENPKNDTIKMPQKVTLPIIINGRIEKAGDVDIFEFQGKANQQVVAEVYARRLNSPVDSLVRIMDQSGKVIKLNDDHVLKDQFLHKDVEGLVTHHADSYLIATLPKDGVYYVHMADSQGHGGQAFGYRLRISEPEPNFALRVTPSNVMLKPGMRMPVTVHVLREDGFDGQIDVSLKDPPEGFQLEGGPIPAGCNRVPMTLLAPRKLTGELVSLKVEGTADVNGREIRNEAIAADDVMQAFLYRHLVTREKLLVDGRKQKWSYPSVQLLGKTPIQLPMSGSVQVKLKTPKRKDMDLFLLELYKPPAGVTLSDVTVVEEGLALTLHADDSVKPGFQDNLIVEVLKQYPIMDKQKKPTGKMGKSTNGVAPAIPIKVVAAVEKKSPVAIKSVEKPAESKPVKK